MAGNERGRAGDAAPDDERPDGGHQRTPREPPAPNVLDLGSGEALVIGTAAAMRAAADWLDRNYPDGPRGGRHGPLSGPVMNMSNYRVRQVLGLGPMPERQLRLLVALATWMGDDSRTVRVGLATLMEECGNTHNTVSKARRELESAGMLKSQGGRGKGNLTVWTALCLPDTAGKGTSDVGPFSGESKGTSDVGPFAPAGEAPKGTNRGSQKVPNEGSKRYQGQRADQQEQNMGFDLRANTSGFISLSAPQGDDGERENDFDDDEDEPDPDVALVAAAVPGAEEEDIEAFLDGLHFRQAHGEIRTVRGYLRTVIANGDVRSLVEEEAAGRRRTERELAEFEASGRQSRPWQAADPFAAGADPWAPAAPNGAPVVVGEVIRADEAELPPLPGWRTVDCPVCDAGPGVSCRNPRTGGYAATHAERHRAAEQQAEEVAP